MKSVSLITKTLKSILLMKRHLYIRKKCIECATIYTKLSASDVLDSFINYDKINNNCAKDHCVKSVRIRRYSGPHFQAFGPE